MVTALLDTQEIQHNYTIIHNPLLLGNQKFQQNLLGTPSQIIKIKGHYYCQILKAQKYFRILLSDTFKKASKGTLNVNWVVFIQKKQMLNFHVFIYC